METRDWLLEEIQKLKLPTVCIDYKMEGMASVMGKFRDYNRADEVIKEERAYQKMYEQKREKRDIR